MDTKQKTVDGVTCTLFLERAPDHGLILCCAVSVENGENVVHRNWYSDPAAAKAAYQAMDEDDIRWRKSLATVKTGKVDRR